MKESYARILIPHERSFKIVFCEKECLVGATFLPEIFGQPPPPPLEIADFQSIFACSESTLTPSKTVQLTLKGSRQRAIQ